MKYAKVYSLRGNTIIYLLQSSLLLENQCELREQGGKKYLQDLYQNPRKLLRRVDTPNSSRQRTNGLRLYLMT